MKDKIYKLNRPKGFCFFKRALIAITSVFICSVCVALPLSILIYTQTDSIVEKQDLNKTNNAEQQLEEDEENETNNELVLEN